MDTLKMIYRKFQAVFKLLRSHFYILVTDKESVVSGKLEADDALGAMQGLIEIKAIISRVIKDFEGEFGKPRKGAKNGRNQSRRPASRRNKSA